MRHLWLVLGDQLNPDALADADPGQDALWMAEVLEESTKVASHQVRTTYFLAAMRHYAEARRQAGWTVHYHSLDDEPPQPSFEAALAATLRTLPERPQALVVVQPGEWGVQQALQRAADAAGLPLKIRPDAHFLVPLAEFERHAKGRKQLRLEYFYREQRQRLGILLDASGGPEGGQWNYDADNRQPLPAGGLFRPPARRRFPPDALTQSAIETVRRRFPDHPGDLDTFDWPVTPAQAQEAMADFIAHRLAQFGPYQDAIHAGEPWLYHATLSAALNLKLLDPRALLSAVEAAYRAGEVPLSSAEGFIRQVLGWREYVRGIYWRGMPDYRDRNALNATQALPGFYWTGETPMACLRDTLQQTLRLGYAHHIQRLMVTGLYALLLGVRPQAVHEWYLAVYVDAIEWVELPNTLGMSQFADGGVMASKPYAASGKYIQRMSNYCAGCRFDPAVSVGPKACPFTTLYWDFLLRHESTLGKNPRMALQVRNLTRLSPEERLAIRQQAAGLQANDGLPTPVAASQ